MEKSNDSLNLLLSLISNEAARQCVAFLLRLIEVKHFLQCTSDIRFWEAVSFALLPSLFSIFWDTAFEHRVLLFEEECVHNIHISISVCCVYMCVPWNLVYNKSLF